jgi:hypothetical protein
MQYFNQTPWLATSLLAGVFLVNSSMDSDHQHYLCSTTHNSRTKGAECEVSVYHRGSYAETYSRSIDTVGLG